MLAERGLAGKSGAVPSNQGPFSYRTVMKDVAREGYRACIRPKGGAGATEAGSRLITRAVFALRIECSQPPNMSNENQNVRSTKSEQSDHYGCKHYHHGM